MLFSDDYYQQLMKERRCGKHQFQKFDFNLGAMTQSDLHHLWLCHVNGGAFKKSLDNERPVIATTGFGLTGVPHAGNIAQILKAIRLQRSGIPVQIVLGDLDAYNGKDAELSKIFLLAGQFKDFILKLGFDDQFPSVLRTQYDSLPVLRTMYMSGHFMEDKMFDDAKEDIHDFYSQHGKIDDTMSYRMKLSLNLMVADFLNLREDYNSVMVFLGIDEYKYVDLAMKTLVEIQKNDDVFSDFSLSGMFSLTMKGFYGYPKMGKSFPNSGVSVEMPDDVVYDRIMNCEGRYGSPNDNVVYQMISTASLYSFDQIDQAYKACLSGGNEWHKTKESYVLHLIEILAKWRK